ncbi:site-specific integrase [Bacteroides acidifaciens]|uniref:site-specific integrase n=1 Tax=Bacteroides acidifaciens TaxID=85831 RepID=UPI003F6552D8
MDICTKVTLRQRLLPSGKITLYLDYYPAIRNPKTNKSQRHEYMGIYLYGNPANRVQREFNQTMLEKAEIIRCRRQEQVINRQFGFIDHSQQREDFLAYFEDVTKKRYQKWKIVYMHFHKFTGGKCTFGEVTVDLCTKFREYLLNANQLRHKKKKVSRNSAAGYFSTFRALLKQAYKERLITENINDYLDYIEWEEVDREFLTQDELIQLAQTPCKHDVLRRASLFSCLTGLRISDIENLRWEHIQPIPAIGLCIVITIQKTKTPVKLPLCDEAIELMGNRGTGKVFKGLKRSMTGKPLKDWITATGISKHITFHCFRHTYSTLQFAANSNPYAVQQSMCHKDIGTTMRYTHEVPTALLETLGKITIKPK